VASLPRLLTEPPRPRLLTACALALAALAKGCASAALPPPTVIAQARVARSYSASLRVSLKGPEIRARTRALVAFRRPDALRVEIPGPTGVRLVAVAREGKLTAVFPGEQAVFEGEAGAADLEALLGVALGPEEVMDLLVGSPSPRLRSYEARWGPTLPRAIDATLPDGGRLKVTVDDAAAGVALSPQAFAPPAHSGYRKVAAEEARRMWGGR